MHQLKLFILAPKVTLTSHLHICVHLVWSMCEEHTFSLHVLLLSIPFYVWQMAYTCFLCKIFEAVWSSNWIWKCLIFPCCLFNLLKMKPKGFKRYRDIFPEVTSHLCFSQSIIHTTTNWPFAQSINTHAFGLTVWPVVKHLFFFKSL